MVKSVGRGAMTMFAEIDLRKLAEMTAPDRAFLSLYLEGPKSFAKLEKRFPKIRRMLAEGSGGRDEREHFDQNLESVLKYLKKNPLESGSLCLFSCWALDFFQAIPITARVKDLVWIDSSPFIRPLAELQDEYENVAVVVADNKRARVYLVSSALAGSETAIEGNVKNHVKKGGWSQKRYERRRDKQLLLYAKKIADKLGQLDREETFRRILLVGGKEILRSVAKNLPPALAKKVVGQKALDLGRGDEAIRREIMDLFFEEERLSEKRLWEAIRGEYLRGGLGVVGLDEVLEAAQAGRVEKVVVNRTYRPQGARCRDCSHLHPIESETCASCDSTSLYPVGIVNELVEILHQTGAEIDFVDPLPSLSGVGDIAALLRY